MKLTPIFALLISPLIALGGMPARDTAYKALRQIGAERDQALLNRVIEVKGHNGTPQPEKWLVILDDPLARGGVREIEIATHRIVSERAPVRAYSGSAEGLVMNFRRLNLDSEGAFAIAEDQAKAAKLGFDSVDYLLRCEDSNSAPVWVLLLLDEDRRQLGKISIAADTGAIISKDLGDDRINRDGGARLSKDSVTRKAPRWEKRTFSGPTAYDIGRNVDRAIHQFGANMEEFFTGRRTLDRRYREEEGR